MDGNTVILSMQKKKAILETLPKLPTAMSRSFHVHHIQTGFLCNGKIDTESLCVPQVDNILNTNCENTDNTILKDVNLHVLMSQFFEEMFRTGYIKEKTFDKFDKP